MDRPLLELLEQKWLNNSLQNWLLAAGTFIAVVVVLRLTKSFVLSWLRKHAEKSANQVDDTLVEALQGTMAFAYFAAGLHAGTRFLTMTDRLQTIESKASLVLLSIQIALWAQRAVGALLTLWMHRHTSAQATTAAQAIRFIANLAVWSILLLTVLSNLGVELTTLIAGLGVGGVAAALAVQQLFGDLIAGLSMYFDRPFDIGDFVIVGDVMGTVTKIGLRTTRIDGLGGDKIVYPNGKLAGQFIRNYRRMEERRIVFAVGIEYGLSAEKVRRAQELLIQIVQEKEGVRFDRAHFKEFGAYSLNFEIVYYVLTGDFNEYMDHQHALNLRIYEEFERAGIPFAFPTRTVINKTFGEA